MFTEPFRIHIHSMKGMYTVARYNKDTIFLETNRRYKRGLRYAFQVPISDFKCLAGGVNEYWDKKVTSKFLSVVRPKVEKIIPDSEMNILPF